ncbi:MAG: hypothetical protein KGY45_01525 [Hadesarchaea archaeon]|nr:hypothetical protein [Hadesarchaea archaeon]
MWLITSIWAAIIATIFYIRAENPKKYNLDWLCLMLWGLSAMVLIDHSIGFLQEGGEFIEITTSGYIENGALLGITMLIPIFVVWEIVALISKRRGEN